MLPAFMLALGVVLGFALAMTLRPQPPVVIHNHPPATTNGLVNPDDLPVADVLGGEDDWWKRGEEPPF